MGGHGQLETTRRKTSYIVIGSTLKELRELVQEGIAGDLEIEGISFEEVFLTNSEATK